MSHIYPVVPDNDDDETPEPAPKWADMYWWYPPAVTLLWIVVIAALTTAPALVLAVWRSLL